MRRERLNGEKEQLAKGLKRTSMDEPESGVLRSLMCFLGLHLWLAPGYLTSRSKHDIRFCFWCRSVEIDGRLYR